jgi:hypothetical protein
MPDGPILHTTPGNDAITSASNDPSVLIGTPPAPPLQSDSHQESTTPHALETVSGADTDPHPSPRAGADDREKDKAKDDPTDYSTLNVGDKLDGIVIHFILLQYPEAIVFTSATGHIYFRHNLGARVDVALVEFYRLTSKSTARLKQAYARQVNGLLGAALAEALSLPDGADLRPPFKAVDDFIDSNGPIKTVFGATDSWVVFIDTDGEIVCDYPTVTDQTAPLLTEFYRLRQLGMASLREHEIDALRHILGTELSIALQRSAAIEPADALLASRDYIQLRNESRMRVRYISASLGAAALFGFIAWLLVRSDLGLLLGCAGGIVGSAISVLQRSADLEIRRFMPPAQVILQGTVRITLGILFGMIVVAAVRAGLVLGEFGKSENTLFIAGVVAGFSERLVPDLLTKIASDRTSSKSQK